MSRLIRSVVLVMGLVAVAGCAASPASVPEPPAEAAEAVRVAVAPAASVLPTAPSPTVTTAATPSPSSTPLAVTVTPVTAAPPPHESLADFPLRLGSTWVYSATYYDTFESERITATYRITETVVETQTQAALSAARIERVTTLRTTSANLAGKDWQEFYLAGAGGRTSSWLVRSGNRLYQQPELDGAAVAADEASLEYIFPLSDGAMWYPDPAQRAQFPNFEIGPGLRTVSGPLDRQGPAGEFMGCYELRTFYNGGSPVSWFCPEVGVVEAQFDHVGTPFGHRLVLEAYTLEPVAEVGPPAPLVELAVSPAAAATGEEVTVSGRVSAIGLPHYTLYLDGEPLLTVTYDNQVKMPLAAEAPVELVSTQATGTEVTFILKPRQPGTLTLSLGATGEVEQASEQGPVWSWGEATSATVTITIS